MRSMRPSGTAAVDHTPLNVSASIRPSLARLEPARQATTILTTFLRTGARMELRSIEQFSYDDYVQTLPDPVFITDTIEAACDTLQWGTLRWLMMGHHDPEIFKDAMIEIHQRTPTLDGTPRG